MLVRPFRLAACGRKCFLAIPMLRGSPNTSTRPLQEDLAIWNRLSTTWWSPCFNALVSMMATWSQCNKSFWWCSFFPCWIAFRSRNKLEFRMSNGKATAEADVTVFDLLNMLRLAVVEVGWCINSIWSLFSSQDKRNAVARETNDGEAQLVAEAVAASMHNRRLIAAVRLI